MPRVIAVGDEPLRQRRYRRAEARGAGWVVKRELGMNAASHPVRGRDLWGGCEDVGMRLAPAFRLAACLTTIVPIGGNRADGIGPGIHAHASVLWPLMAETPP
ncbi:MAG: hypothetical protein OJF49_001736 [Ktedonobacterales bacterium]|nr:MAG: hypothetical protein OJF49_001736 [Ktedonobacterales bacterium]